MTGIIQSTNSGQRKTWAWGCAALGVYWVALIHLLGAQRSIFEQYSYGWAVPFLCAYLVWQRMQESGARSQKSEAGRENPESRKQKVESGHSPHPGPLPRAERELPSSIFYLLIALCALLYAPTRFFQEASPIWRLISWLWALEVVGITLCLLRFTVHGSRFTISDFLFPIGFFLVAVPWPSVVENFLVQTFTRLNVSATVETLGLFGVPAMQHGNEIGRAHV